MPELSSQDLIIKSIKEITFVKMFKENYKELYSRSGLIRFFICLILSIVFVKLLYRVYLTGEYIEMLINLITTLIGGYLGLIAFALSAVAIVTAMITNKFLVHIVENSCSEKKGLMQLRGLFFPFYFSAILDLISLILLIISLIFLYMTSGYTVLFLLIISFITSFSCIYALVYSIQLVGLSIRLRFLAVKY